jgi:hypothetical protein
MNSGQRGVRVQVKVKVNCVLVSPFLMEFELNFLKVAVVTVQLRARVWKTLLEIFLYMNAKGVFWLESLAVERAGDGIFYSLGTFRQIHLHRDQTLMSNLQLAMQALDSSTFKISADFRK